MTYYRNRSRSRRVSNAKPDTLPLRFAAALLIVAVVLVVRHYDPTLLEPLRARLNANTGEVAEAFARFTDTIGEGKAVAEAWSVLTEDLADLTAGEQ